MPSPTSLLRALKRRPSPEETLGILQELSRARLRPEELLRYHEILLFYKAYPRSPEIRRFCDLELNRFIARIRKLRKREFEELDQTSVVGTRIRYPYDEPMARWLLRQLNGHVDFDWETYEQKADDPLAAYIHLLMEPSAADAVDSPDFSTRDLIEAARGSQTTPAWLLNRFGVAFPDPHVRQEIYNGMNLPLTMALVPPGPSRTLLDDGPPRKLSVWKAEAGKVKFDLMAEIRRPIRIPPPVSPKRGRELLDLVYGTLLIRLRELYPATHANLSEIYDIPLERGIRIIWFFMKPEMRLPLEAGWGCLILRNNVPIGYGAGGMVADQSEISINIYDTFRGGEAAWLYSQYARICYQWCRAPWLVTRKWQLGGDGNEEGIESGSYWFYDKLGFRSVDPKLRRLAHEERRKIIAQPGYRSPIRVLRRLAQADMVLSLTGHPAEDYRDFPLGQIGLAAARVAAGQFGGTGKDLDARVLKEMKRRFGVSYEGWTRDEKTRFAQMSLIVLALPNVERFTAGERRMFLKLGRAKGFPREADYAALMPYNRKFFEELRKLAKA
jgi:hypothetical protein